MTDLTVSRRLLRQVLRINETKLRALLFHRLFNPDEDFDPTLAKLWALACEAKYFELEDLALLRKWAEHDF